MRSILLSIIFFVSYFSTIHVAYCKYIRINDNKEAIKLYIDCNKVKPILYSKLYNNSQYCVSINEENQDVISKWNLTKINKEIFNDVEEISLCTSHVLYFNDLLSFSHNSIVYLDLDNKIKIFNSIDNSYVGTIEDYACSSTSVAITNDSKIIFSNSTFMGVNYYSQINEILETGYPSAFSICENNDLNLIIIGGGNKIYL